MFHVAELPSSAGFRRKERERGIAGEWIMFTSERHAQGSVVAMDTAQVDWSASVMRDTTVSKKKKTVYWKKMFFYRKDPCLVCRNLILKHFLYIPFHLFNQQVMTAPSQAQSCQAPSKITLNLVRCLQRVGSLSTAVEWAAAVGSCPLMLTETRSTLVAVS